MSESRSKDILARDACGWQPIETAPKDITHKSGSYEYGRTVLVYDGNVITACWWQCRKKDGAIYGSNWIDNGANALHPTHWMPLPDPPLPRGDVSIAITGVSAKGIAGNLLASRSYNTNTWNNKVPCAVCGNPADFAEHAHGQASAFHRFRPAPDPPEVKK